MKNPVVRETAGQQRNAAITATSVIISAKRQFPVKPEASPTKTMGREITLTTEPRNLRKEERVVLARNTTQIVAENIPIVLALYLIAGERSYCLLCSQRESGEIDSRDRVREIVKENAIGCPVGVQVEIVNYNCSTYPGVNNL